VGGGTRDGVRLTQASCFKRGCGLTPRPLLFARGGQSCKMGLRLVDWLLWLVRHSRKRLTGDADHPDHVGRPLPLPCFLACMTCLVRRWRLHLAGPSAPLQERSHSARRKDNNTQRLQQTLPSVRRTSISRPREWRDQCKSSGESFHSARRMVLAERGAAVAQHRCDTTRALSTSSIGFQVIIILYEHHSRLSKAFWCLWRWRGCSECTP
jgi:hypothetical protein